MTYKTNTTKALQNNLYLCSCLQLKEWVNMDSPTRLLGRSLCLMITGCCRVIQQIHFEYFMRRITNILHKRNTHIGVLIAHSVSVWVYHKVCDRNSSHGTTPHHVQLLNVDISSSYMVLSPWYLLTVSGFLLGCVVYIWTKAIATVCQLISTKIISVWNDTALTLVIQSHNSNCINTLRSWQHHFANAIFKCIFLNEHFWILDTISLKWVRCGPISNMSALVQIGVVCSPQAIIWTSDGLVHWRHSGLMS